jgi:hypothetical protein
MNCCNSFLCSWCYNFCTVNSWKASRMLAYFNSAMLWMYQIDSYALDLLAYFKFKEVWYQDSAKQHPPLKFPGLQNVLNWSVSSRFCSQKFNLLVFLISIADHVGPLVMHRTEWRKERKKPKATLKHKTNLAVRPRFFMVSSYLFGTALTCHFGTSMQCA